MNPIVTVTDKYTLEIVKTLLKHNVSNAAILAAIETIEKMNQEQQRGGERDAAVRMKPFLHTLG